MITCVLGFTMYFFVANQGQRKGLRIIERTVSRFVEHYGAALTVDRRDSDSPTSCQRPLLLSVAKSHRSKSSDLQIVSNNASLCQIVFHLVQIWRGCRPCPIGRSFERRHTC